MANLKATLLAALPSVLLSACLLRTTPPVVKIGLVAPFEGLYRSLGYDALFAVRLALRERNEAGGIEGYRVLLVALDDSAEPSRAEEQARELALDPQVMGVLGHLQEETTLAAAPVYAQHGLPLIALGVSSMPWGESASPILFRLDADQEHLARALWEHARGELGATRIAVLGFRDDVTAVLVEAVREFGDAEVRSYSTPSSLLAAAADESWDAVLYSGLDQTGAQLIDGLRAMGSSAAFLGDQGLDSPVFAAWAGPEAEGVVYASSNALADDRSFIARYRALAGADPGPRAALAYDAARVLLEAIEGSIQRERYPTREGVLGALRRGEVYVGLTGDIRFDENGRRVAAPTHLYRLEDNGYPGVPIGKYVERPRPGRVP